MLNKTLMKRCSSDISVKYGPLVLCYLADDCGSFSESVRFHNRLGVIIDVSGLCTNASPDTLSRRLYRG